MLRWLPPRRRSGTWRALCAVRCRWGRDAARCIICGRCGMLRRLLESAALKLGRAEEQAGGQGGRGVERGRVGRAIAGGQVGTAEGEWIAAASLDGDLAQAGLRLG